MRRFPRANCAANIHASPLLLRRITRRITSTSRNNSLARLAVAERDGPRDEQESYASKSQDAKERVVEGGRGRTGAPWTNRPSRFFEHRSGENHHADQIEQQARAIRSAAKRVANQECDDKDYRHQQHCDQIGADYFRHSIPRKAPSFRGPAPADGTAP